MVTRQALVYGFENLGAIRRYQLNSTADLANLAQF